MSSRLIASAVGARLVWGALLGSWAQLLLACAPVVGRVEPSAVPEGQVGALASQSPGGSRSRPAAAEAPRPPDVERWLSLTRQLGDVIVTAGADCARVATAVSGFTAKHGAEMLRLNAALLDWEAATSNRSTSRLYAEARPHINHRVDAAIRCDARLEARRAFDTYLKATGLDTR